MRNNPLSLIDPTGFGDASAQALTLLPAAPLVVPFIPELTVTAAVTGAPSATVVFGIRAAAAAPGFSGGNMYGGFGAANYGWSKVASQQVSAQADNQSNAPKPEVDNAKPQEVSSGGQMDPDHDPKKSDDVKRDANGQLRDGKGRFASDPDNPPNPSDYSTTDRRNDWKAESTNPTREYSPEDMARMKKGLPPQRFDPITGNVESMERSHEPVPRRDGGKQTVPRWPDEHAAVDPHRQLKKQPPPPPPPLQKDKDKEHQ